MTINPEELGLAKVFIIAEKSLINLNSVLVCNRSIKVKELKKKNMNAIKVKIMKELDTVLLDKHMKKRCK